MLTSALPGQGKKIHLYSRKKNPAQKNHQRQAARAACPRDCLGKLSVGSCDRVLAERLREKAVARGSWRKGCVSCPEQTAANYGRRFRAAAGIQANQRARRFGVGNVDTRRSFRREEVRRSQDPRLGRGKTAPLRRVTKKAPPTDAGSCRTQARVGIPEFVKPSPPGRKGQNICSLHRPSQLRLLIPSAASSGAPRNLYLGRPPKETTQPLPPPCLSCKLQRTPQRRRPPA